MHVKRWRNGQLEIRAILTSAAYEAALDLGNNQSDHLRKVT